MIHIGVGITIVFFFFTLSPCINAHAPFRVCAHDSTSKTSLANVICHLPILCTESHLQLRPVLHRLQRLRYEWRLRSIIVKDLVRVLKNGVDHPDLPASIGNVTAAAGPHEGRAEDDGEVLATHPVDTRVLDHTVEVECESTERSVVGVWQAVDDGMERVSTHRVIVDPCSDGSAT